MSVIHSILPSTEAKQLSKGEVTLVKSLVRKSCSLFSRPLVFKPSCLTTMPCKFFKMPLFLMWLILLYLFTDRGNDNWLIKYEQATTQGNGDGKEVGCKQIRPRDYKSFFMP